MMRRRMPNAVVGALVLAAVATTAAGGARVVDGDTIEVFIPCPRGEACETVTIRLADLDTPETWRPDCPAEEWLGERATAAVERMIRGAEVVHIRMGEPGRFGRPISTVEVTTNIATALKARGLAQGWPREMEWCDGS